MNNLPIKKENGIIARIKAFFVRLKSGLKKQDAVVETVQKDNNPNNVDAVFKEQLKIKETKSIDEIDNMYDVIRIVEKNTSLLEKLSIKKLEWIEQYYDKKINLLTQK